MVRQGINTIFPLLRSSWRPSSWCGTAWCWTQWSVRELIRPLLFQIILVTFILVRNGLVLDTMVLQEIHTTSPVSAHLGGLHPVAERPGAGHVGPPEQVSGADRLAGGGAGADGRSHRGLRAVGHGLQPALFPVGLRVPGSPWLGALLDDHRHALSSLPHRRPFPQDRLSLQVTWASSRSSLSTGTVAFFKTFLSTCNVVFFKTSLSTGNVGFFKIISRYRYRGLPQDSLSVSPATLVFIKIISLSLCPYG